MALNGIGSTAEFSQVVSGLMNRVDANHDGQLSGDEFGSFLTSLLQGVSQASPTSPNSSSIATTSLLRGLSGAPSYLPVLGFDGAKMNDLTHTTPKYQFARAVQDLGLLGAPTTGNLQAIVDALNANGANAKVAGDDTIDFGGDVGVVDVIFSVGGSDARWQWEPTA